MAELRTVRGVEAFEGGVCAVSIGNFDGVHRGHQAILGRLVERASTEEAGPLPTVALTFHPHPARVVRPDSAPLRLTTPEQQAEFLAATGIGTLVRQPFDAALAALSPEEFARRLLARGLGARLVVVGSNFRFGRGRAGDVERLRELGEALGFRVEAVDPVLEQGVVISSSRIREAVAEGWIERANAMLGRPHQLTGLCVPGASRGRSLGFPTANLKPDQELLPAPGVYVTRCEEFEEGRPRQAVTNIGTRPTFRGEGQTIETHVLDWEGELRGRRLRLHLLRRLREEKRFDSAEDLVAQIRRDIAAART